MFVMTFEEILERDEAVVEIISQFCRRFNLVAPKVSSVKYINSPRFGIGVAIGSNSHWGLMIHHMHKKSALWLADTLVVNWCGKEPPLGLKTGTNLFKVFQGKSGRYRFKKLN